MNDFTIEAEFFNELANDVHTKENHKWWYDEDGTEKYNPDYQLKMLVVSELSEAMEGFRRNLKDDKLTHRDMIEVELADVVLRLLDRMVGKNLSRFVNDYKYNKEDCNTGNYNFVENLFEATIMVTIPDNTTEAIVFKVLDIGYSMGYDVLGALKEKREFNKIRKDHSYKSRKSVNGKKF